MKKLILYLFFAFSAIISMAQTRFDVNNLTYEILSESDRTVEVHDCNGTVSGDLSIPATISYNGKNYSVTVIGQEAFFGCGELTSVIIPNSVVSISEKAFYWCIKLTEITIPSSVRTIGKMAFTNCNGLTMINVDSENEHYKSIDGVLFNFDTTILLRYPEGNSRTAYIIPNSVISISEDAFYKCSGLTSVTISNSVTSIAGWAFYNSGLISVTIPNSVISIGESAFSNCDRLTTVTIPNSVVSIGESAFSNCDRLTTVTIPKSVTSIGGMAFSGCDGLTMINVESGNNHYKSIDGILFDFDATTLIQYPIGNDRTSYIIPNSVTSIGNSAFCSCGELTSVTIPNSVTTIGNSAFSLCDGLTSVVISNSVTTIGNSAFNSCDRLISVTIPSSVTTIGDGAFADCDKLTMINVDSGNNHYKSIDGVLFNFDVTTLIQYPAGNGRTTYMIPNSVSIICPRAFCRCSMLMSVTIPNSVISIGSYAFTTCLGLQEVTNFARDPQQISSDAFFNVQLDNVRLSVPSLSVEKYKNADIWKDFGTIEGMVLPEFRFCSNNYYFETISIQLCGETEFTFPTADILMPYDGFNLEGWTTNADGTGKMFKPNQIVPLDELKGLFMFYAKWVDSAGIDAVETDKIVVSGGVLRNPAGIEMHIYDLNGREMYSGNDYELRIPTGLYILQTPNGNRKVVF